MASAASWGLKLPAIASEPPDAKVIAPGSRESMKAGESPRSRFSAAHYEGTTKTPIHQGQAHEDQNETFTDLSSSADLPESKLPRVLQRKRTVA